MKTSLKTPNKFVESAKKGLNDIKLVMEEGNYKLFLKQIVAVIIIILLYRYVGGTFENKKINLRGQIDAVQAQHDNEQEYQTNKQKLLDLEPRFPDLSSKSDWLLRQLVAVFRESNISPTLGSSQTEDSSNAGFTVAAIPVTFQTSFGDFGRLLASIENKPEYLRISEFSLTKISENLGQNEIDMRINTVFPKEKIADKMFKNAAGGTK